MKASRTPEAGTGRRARAYRSATTQDHAATCIHCEQPVIPHRPQHGTDPCLVRETTGLHGCEGSGLDGPMAEIAATP